MGSMNMSHQCKIEDDHITAIQCDDVGGNPKCCLTPASRDRYSAYIFTQPPCDQALGSRSKASNTSTTAKKKKFCCESGGAATCATIAGKPSCCYILGVKGKCTPFSMNGLVKDTCCDGGRCNEMKQCESCALDGDTCSKSEDCCFYYGQGKSRVECKSGKCKACKARSEQCPDDNCCEGLQCRTNTNAPSSCYPA